MTQYVVAADMGGTHLRAALVDEGGTISARRDVPTPASQAGEQIIAWASGVIVQVAAEAPSRPLGACVAVAGLVNGVEDEKPKGYD